MAPFSLVEMIYIAGFWASKHFLFTWQSLILNEAVVVADEELAGADLQVVEMENFCISSWPISGDDGTSFSSTWLVDFVCPI